MKTMCHKVKKCLFSLIIVTAGTCLQLQAQSVERSLPDTAALRQAAAIIGLRFTGPELLQMQRSVADQGRNYISLRKNPIPNGRIPALVFHPAPPGFIPPAFEKPAHWPDNRSISLPSDRNELAFMTIHELAGLIRSKQITSVELTRFFLERLKRHNDSLLCVVAFTEELAMKQAEKADQEVREGKYRGQLHGIPYGVKDLMSVPGYPTTWGAGPYKDQRIDETAHVVQKLTDAGAVLIAKLTSGALAMGDVWFGGTTKNPWNLKRGSSGSSAGPASATAAGLVAFAIGTETLGSIVSPSTRCGVTGLRPTFGRVGRTGTMALSWSMDKIGPICRTAMDCAIVLDAIHGPDIHDPATTTTGFTFTPINSFKGLKIGYLEKYFNQNYQGKQNDSIALAVFREHGAKLIPVELPENFPVSAMRIILSAEAAAAFDDLTRSDRDTLLDAQGSNDWPNTFRASRFITAVEYIQANRIREELILEMNRLFSGYDLIIAPTFGGNQLTITNLTGQPCLVLPDGFDAAGNPTTISLLGNLFREDILCEAGYLYQQKTGFYRIKPTLFKQ
ncbi:MAG: amidase [Bacteroidetes bacterium GWF2_49_14]|nr:MAG: amidase [Bacteroidetes bacterium GWF2_49_14]